MLILTLRTDKPEAEIGLFDNQKQLAYQTWPAHRELSKTLHHKIHEVLRAHNKTLQDVSGIVAFQGPGSFTGLRIGLSALNALAYGLNIPIVATQGDDWAQKGTQRLKQNQNDNLALPRYGAPVHVTKPKK